MCRASVTCMSAKAGKKSGPARPRLSDARFLTAIHLNRFRKDPDRRKLGVFTDETETNRILLFRHCLLI